MDSSQTAMTPAVRQSAVDLSSEPADDQRLFRKFAGCFPTGVAVVTTRDAKDQLFGTTMNSVTSLSLAPPLYLMCFGAHSNTLSAILESRIFCINFLAADQIELSQRFASKSTDKFAGIDYIPSDNGVPLLNGVVAACDGTVVQVYGGGDHTIVIGRIRHVRSSEREPLVVHRGRYGLNGG